MKGHLVYCSCMLLLHKEQVGDWLVKGHLVYCSCMLLLKEQVGDWVVKGHLVYCTYRLLLKVAGVAIACLSSTHRL